MVTEQERQRDRKKWWSIHDKSRYICPDCGRTIHADGVSDIEVHHINRQAGKCVALCNECHKVRHGADRGKINVDWWKRDFVDELCAEK